VNHALFWENLAPKGNGGGGNPVGSLADAIKKGVLCASVLFSGVVAIITIVVVDFGSLEQFKEKFTAAAVGVQVRFWHDFVVFFYIIIAEQLMCDR
jgi:Fe-Mn family superoxide dismutase